MTRFSLSLPTFRIAGGTVCPSHLYYQANGINKSKNQTWFYSGGNSR